MRIKLAVLALSVAASALSLASAPMFADTLTLTGVGGANSDGVYVYPYLFTVTEGGKTVANVALSCLNFDREVSIGETWAVKEYAVPAGSGTLDGESFASFRTDAWLNNQYSNPNYTATEVQFAIWSIMDPGGVSGKQGFDAQSQALASQAVSAAAAEPASYFANNVIFIPDTSNQSGWGSNGEPQIFMAASNPIAPTPEPSSLALLGTGLFATVGVLKRRMRTVPVSA